MTEPTNHKEITALIKRISGQANFIGTPRIYVDIFDGDLVAAVWFNQVVYWDGKTSEPIGFYKTYAEWRAELGLSRYQVNRVAQACQQRGLVNIMFRKVYGTPKNHYLVIWPELLRVLKETLEKSDSEETDSSETRSSESKESEGSMEGQESVSSLSIEEITSKNDLSDSKEIYWQMALDLLKQEVSRGSFDTYLKDTQAVRYDGNALTIGVRNAYARDWLESRVQSTVQRLLVGILNCSVQVEFVTLDHVEVE